MDKASLRSCFPRRTVVYRHGDAGKKSDKQKAYELLTIFVSEIAGLLIAF
jgi:hypothetical protein